ncbi:hypothetical protein H6B15_13865 [Gemmiger formicilis]|nr:hypothetical protein [Gemmiger formicilis]
MEGTILPRLFLCGSGTKFTGFLGQSLCKSPIPGEKSVEAMDNPAKVKYNNPELLSGVTAW